MNKLLIGLIGLGVTAIAATAAMYFVKKDDPEDFWDDYDEDDSILLDGSEDILTPFQSDKKAEVSLKKDSSPDVDNHQNDLI